MVTMEQALTAPEFHANGCARRVGPRGGVTYQIERYRPSGRIKTWKTRPTEFRLPIKHGMYYSTYLTHDNASDFHTLADCPLR